MDPIQEIKYKCLRLANEKDDAPDYVLHRARHYSDFILGKKDQDIIDAVKELAEKI